MTGYRYIEHSTFRGLPSMEMGWDHYTAVILPQHGANLISFVETSQDYHFVREPSLVEIEEFCQRPYTFGIPVLFPPNRYDGGKFTLRGREYRLPVNEQNRNNHLHGFLYDIPWNVDDFGVTDSNVFIQLSQQVDTEHPAFNYWPHPCLLTLRYSLDENGLSQHVSVKNTGKESMPCFLGFHTAVRVPFAPGSAVEDYRVKLTVNGRWELDHRGLPTGRLLPPSQQEEQLRSVGISPFAFPMDNHYSAHPQDGYNRMELMDTKQRVKLIYNVGSSYRFWMFWNNGAQPGFFCAEPQTNMVNAPNVQLPEEATGVISIAPGETWEDSSRLHVVTGLEERTRFVH